MGKELRWMMLHLRGIRGLGLKEINGETQDRDEEGSKLK